MWIHHIGEIMIGILIALLIAHLILHVIFKIQRNHQDQVATEKEREQEKGAP